MTDADAPTPRPVARHRVRCSRCGWSGDRRVDDLGPCRRVREPLEGRRGTNGEVVEAALCGGEIVAGPGTRGRPPSGRPASTAKVSIRLPVEAIEALAAWDRTAGVASVIRRIVVAAVERGTY